MPRERMRDLELPAYMRALVEAREKWMDESSGRLNEHIEHLEWIDELAVALGIAVDAEDWWDSTVPAKRKKIMGRISVLRSLRPAQETCSAPYDTAANFARSCTVVPKGHFWRGVPESNRHQCRNCGEHYDKHLHTDEASTCPTAETSPVQAVCDRAAHLADVPTPLKTETPAAPEKLQCDYCDHEKVIGGCGWPNCPFKKMSALNRGESL